MAISKKGSRKITVGDEGYIWVVTPLTKGQLALTIQHQNGTGKIIRVYIRSDINDYWVEFPNVTDLNLRIVKLLSEVSSIITQALTHGWDPLESGAPLNFDLRGSTLIKRNS